MTSMSTRPQWAMFGVDAGDGTVHLYASQTLTYVELMAVYDGDETFRPLGWRPTLFGIRFSGEMRDFVLVVGTDYADAFRRLFDTWTPGDGAARPGLPTAPSALPPG